MILATHAIVGAAAGRFFSKNLLVAFLLGFISHFFLDAIPHWDYQFKSYHKDSKNPLKNDIVINKYFLRDVFAAAIDCILGFTLAIYLFGGGNVFSTTSLPVLMGALGGVAPDALQFVYFKFRREPFTSLQKFHFWVHTEKRLNDEPFKGIVYQLSLVVLAVLISKFV